MTIFLAIVFLQEVSARDYPVQFSKRIENNYIKSRLENAPPDTAYIITGLAKKRILIGKAGWRMPSGTARSNRFPIWTEKPISKTFFSKISTRPWNISSNENS